MQLNTADAVRLGFVLDRNRNLLDDNKYINASSFDLSIRDVLIRNKKTKEVESHSDRSVVISPQDTAYLISEEIIRIPKGYIAYVFLKNRQSQRGLLALNTGIIDQEYYGAISTLVTNLSSEDVILPDTSSGGKLFFRVVFHRITDNIKEPEQLIFPEKCNDYVAYKEYRKIDLKKFPSTFLDVEAVERKISARISSELSGFSYMRLGATMAGVGILLSLFPLARDYYFTQKFELSEYVTETKKTQLSLDNISKNLEELHVENTSMRNTITSLEKELLVVKYKLEKKTLPPEKEPEQVR